MADKTSRDQQQERVMYYLANSVLELSDEDIRDEAAATGDPQQAERTRSILRNAARVVEKVNRCLLDLGHTISPQRWQQDGGGYSNHCLTCGLPVNFTSATGTIWGSALEAHAPRQNACSGNWRHQLAEQSSTNRTRTATNHEGSTEGPPFSMRSIRQIRSAR
jgi:hypothetical protein